MRYRMLSIAIAVAMLGGCGDSGSTDDSGEPTGDSQPGVTASNESQSDVEADPVEAVTAFLEAVRSGDDATAASMFTKMAREKAAEMNIEVAPKGSDTARYEIGQAEYVDESLVKVPSSWSDYDPQGELHTDQMAWMLRREPEGWRVAGMAATVFEGEPPLLLDFENPEETLRKLESLRNEIVRRSEAEAYQATQPAAAGGEVLR